MKGKRIVKDLEIQNSGWSERTKNIGGELN